MMGPGDVVGGRYTIEAHIAEGGMSHVYRALDKKTKKTVAVKILKEEHREKELLRAAFEKEARTTMRLKHRNIIHTSVMGQQDGLPYMVMDYVEGENLKQHLAEKGWLSDPECIELGKKICGALTYAHHKGVIHKDLKPSNILLDREGEPILSDFGIAEEETEQAAGDEDRAPVLGSAAYFSPEQARGEAVDQRTDIYSLGVMLYELATGRLPFTAEDSLSMALKHLHQIPEPPITIRRDMLPSLSKVIMRAMAKDREERYSSAAMMERDLSKCMDDPEGEYVRVSDELVGEEEAARRRTAHRHRVLALSILFTALIAVLFLLIFGLASNFTMNPGTRLFMPNLVNRTEDEAIQAIESMGLKAEVTYETGVQQGSYVIRQSPESGVEVRRGDTVEIVVNRGENVSSMPSVVGLTRAQGLRALSAAGLSVPTIVVDEATVTDEEEILRQLPEAGEAVRPEDDIVLYVSAAPAAAPEEVPELVGRYISDAVGVAREAGYAHILIYRSTMGEEPGVVLSQTPDPGTDGAETDGTLRVTMESLGVPNYVGSIHLDAALLTQGSTIQLTIPETIDGETCEFVVFEATVENAMDFSDQYGDGIGFSVYLPLETETAQREVTVYRNGQMVAVSGITLTQGGTS